MFENSYRNHFFSNCQLTICPLFPSSVSVDKRADCDICVFRYFLCGSIKHQSDTKFPQFLSYLLCSCDRNRGEIMTYLTGVIVGIILLAIFQSYHHLLKLVLSFFALVMVDVLLEFNFFTM